MDCLDAKPKLEPCARGELSAADRAELDRHIATCEGCRLELELTRAVLGSSSSTASDDPALDSEEEGSLLGAIPPEPTIEQERVPQPEPDGPEPPRVLTSQLPEETEEPLDIASIANAYDPGAIDLPHPEADPGHEDVPSQVAHTSAGHGASFSEEEPVSLEDMALDAPSLATTPSISSQAGSSKSPAAGTSWGFEPVDVPRTAAPPEESLTFAKEALGRKRGAALRGRTGARLLLWIGGAVGGVGLLGASVWMALAFRDVPAGDPANVPAVQPPPGTAPFPSPADSAVVPEVEPGMTASDSTSLDPPAPAVIKAGAAGTGAIAPEISQKPVPRPQTAKASDPVRSSGAQPGSSPTKAPEAASRTPNPAGSTASTAPAFRDDELAPAPRRAPPILTVEPDAAPGSEKAYETDDEPRTTAKESTKPVSTAPIFLPPSSGSGQPTGGAATGSSDAAASGPMGRLHLATEAAHRNGDLEALRKLRTSWKTMVRSATGTDRARAKREYADCLWAIQEITKRDADRKEALTAYRDYVLYAPAGGADARTVSRMRHLEDILSSQ